MAHIEFILAAVTIVLTFAWLISRFVLSRRTSRDLVWRTALVVVAITPGLSLVRGACLPWQWSIPILPVASTGAADATGQAVASKPLFKKLLPADQAATKTAVGSTNGPLQARPGTGDSPELDGEPRQIATAANASGPDYAETRTLDRGSSWLAILIRIWIAGFLFQSARIGRAAWNAHRLIASAVQVIDPSLLELNDWSARRVGLPHPALLLTSPGIDVPVVSGLVQPKIVVPPCLLTDDTRAQLRAALLHECGHIHRCDLAFDLLLKVVVAALWPHPLVHLMAAELRRLREEICDNYVLAEESPVAYSEMLLRFAVGKRLRPDALLGLSMFAKTTRLEARVNEILAPDRQFETRPRQPIRRLVVGATLVGLAASIVIRFDRAAAAPPIPSLSQAGTAEDAISDQKAGTEKQKAGDRPQQPPREFHFKIVTTQGKPVAGATVSGEGVCRAYFSGVQHTVVAKSDANGIVRVVLTEQMDQIVTSLLAQSGLPGIDEIRLRVDHPDYPIWADSISVTGDRSIVLADPTTITVQARRADESALATRLYPEVSSHYPDDWTEVDGVLAIRRVDLSSEHASRWLRIVQVPERGPAWFSAVVDLKHIAGNSISLDVTLRPGVFVAGRLVDDVPRPVQKGRAIGLVSGNPDGSSRLAWHAVAEIAADGSFVFESVPESDNLQVIALCDGWVSRSPPKQELASYAAEHHFPAPSEIDGSEPRAGMVFPQLYRLDKPVVEVVIGMQPTAACEVTVLDPAEKPISDAVVRFSPNQFFHNYGSGSLGSGRDSAVHIRNQLDSEQRRQESNGLPNGDEYSAKTNAIGVAVVSGLPGPPDASFTGDLDGVRQAIFQIEHEGYVAISNFPSDGETDFPGPLLVVPVFLVAPLSSGKTERVIVRMTPPQPPQMPENPETPEEKGPAPASAAANLALSGRVVDEEGQPIEGVQVLPFNQDCFNLRSDSTGQFHYKFGDEDAMDGWEGSVFPVRLVKPGYAPVLLAINLEKRDHVVTLQTKTYFEGTVRSPDGTPAPRARVRANQAVPVGQNGPIPISLDDIWTESQTDADGRYRLLVQPGSYVIAAGNPGEAVAWRPQIIRTNSAQNERFREPSERLRLRILPNEAKNLDIDLEPIVDFRMKFIDSVTAQPIPDVRFQVNDDYPGVAGQSDPTGSLAIRSLPAGEFTCFVHVQGYLRGWSDDAMPRWKNSGSQEFPRGSLGTFFSLHHMVTFVLEQGMPESTYVLERHVTVSGRVLDPDGVPVPRATVNLVRAEGDTLAQGPEQRKFYVKPDGTFTALLPPSGEGQYHLMVHDDSVEQAEKGRFRFDGTVRHAWANGAGPLMETTAGQTIDNFELRLTRPGTIRGRVVDKTGKPLARVSVQSMAVDNREGAKHNPVTHSDGEGHFELRYLSPGRHRLYRGESKRNPVAPSDGVTWPTVDVKAGATADAGDVLIPAESAGS